MNKQFLAIAAVLGALAVIAGAFLAHQLKSMMPEKAVEVYDTAVRYQFYHVYALLAVGIISEKFKGPWMRRAGICFTTGIILFSGSLYIISSLLTAGLSVPAYLGILTPLGGAGFILGWIFLAYAVRRGPAV
jgi:uncharacterized membrane protein YgdD (TMEM256/DUF423 family)